jgi:outer membrane murein-binding lipoprotein Lpp
MTERRKSISELVSKVADLKEQVEASHVAFHGLQQDAAEQKTTIAVQGEQLTQVLKVTKEIKLGLWGEEGTGGLFGEIKSVKDSIDTEIKSINAKQNTMSGWLKGLGVSVIAAIGASIGAFLKK